MSGSVCVCYCNTGTVSHSTRGFISDTNFHPKVLRPIGLYALRGERFDNRLRVHSVPRPSRVSWVYTFHASQSKDGRVHLGFRLCDVRFFVVG